MSETQPVRRLGILVKTYPKLSETFILGEILRLESRGLPLAIFSLRLPSDALAHDMRHKVKANIRYDAVMRWARTMQIVVAHGSLLARNPFRYVKTFAFALGRGERGGLREFIEAGCLVRPLRELGIAHLHVHFASEPAGVAELLQMLCAMPFSISAHAKDIYLSTERALQRKLGKARFTVTCTDAGRQHLCAATSAPVSLVYHGVDLASFVPPASMADRAQARPPAPLILAVGRLRDKKGFDVLIESCRALRDAGYAFRCQIVGYGPQREKLQATIDRHGLGDHVALTGAMTRAALIELYGQASLFVMPCRVTADGDRDGIPNVVLEAMAMALPVVSTTISGIPEVITDDVDGLLVAPGNSDALTAAIRRLIEQPTLCRRLGVHARTKVEQQFCAEQNVDPLYQRLQAAMRDSIGQPTGQLSEIPGHV